MGNSERTFEISDHTRLEASKRNSMGRHQRNAESGERVRCECGDSSLHLGVSENAVETPIVAGLLEHGAPSVTLEIEGKLRRLILDTSSNVSIPQLRVSRIDVTNTSLKPNGVT